MTLFWPRQGGPRRVLNCQTRLSPFLPLTLARASQPVRAPACVRAWARLLPPASPPPQVLASTYKQRHQQHTQIPCCHAAYTYTCARSSMLRSTSHALGRAAPACAQQQRRRQPQHLPQAKRSKGGGGGGSSSSSTPMDQDAKARIMAAEARKNSSGRVEKGSWAARAQVGAGGCGWVGGEGGWMDPCLLQRTYVRAALPSGASCAAPP